jgi:hypothetical protein
MATAPSGTAGRSSRAMPQQAAQAPAVVPFIRGSGLNRPAVFYDTSGLTLTTSTQDLGPIDVYAYDYMRAITIRVDTTSAGGGSGATTVEDGPFCMLTNIKVLQPNGQTMYQVSSGFSSAMIHKYGGYQYKNDPREAPDYTYTTGSGTAPSASFIIRIPFELNIRDALGTLPNKNAAAPFKLFITLNTLANVWGGSPTTPTFRVRCALEAWDQPPSSLNGAPVQTTPPNMNTLQRWTEQQIAVSSGNFDARLTQLGNYIRMLIPILRRSSSTRANGEADWPDPVSIVLDNDVKDYIPKEMWVQDVYEKWGYALVGQGTAGVGDVANAKDNGVYPYDYCHEFDGKVGHETGDLYLPTIESEQYVFRGSWGNAGTITLLINDVLPQGNIFS